MRLAGGGDFSRGRLFALCDFRVRGFDFRDGIQPATELTAASIQVPPFRIPGAGVGGNSVLVEFVFKG